MQTETKFDPRIRLTFCLCMILLAVSGLAVSIKAALLILVLLSEILSFGSLKKLRVVLLIITAAASQILLLQLLFNRTGEVLLTFSVIKIYRGALYDALEGIVQISLIAFSSVQFLSHTDDREGEAMLRAFGVPPKYAACVPLAAVFLPIIKSEFTAVQNAQRVRGGGAGMSQRLKLLFSGLLPFIIRSLRRSGDIALSMELSGFGRERERTELYPLKMNTGEKIILAVLCAILSGILLGILIKII